MALSPYILGPSFALPFLSLFHFFLSFFHFSLSFTRYAYIFPTPPSTQLGRRKGAKRKYGLYPFFACRTKRRERMKRGDKEAAGPYFPFLVLWFGLVGIKEEMKMKIWSMAPIFLSRFIFWEKAVKGPKI